MAHDVIVDKQEYQHEYVITKVGYQGYDQAPLVMVYKEFVDKITGKVNWAEPLYTYPPPPVD